MSRSSNQKRKRKARAATGVPCERPRPVWRVGRWMSTPPGMAFSADLSAFAAALRVRVVDHNNRTVTMAIGAN